MSQLTAPTHTLADNIPLGRRITEIMTEKGPAYTIAAMAKRLEINRETLRLMLKGEREIYTFELEKIAQDLKVPVKRILQSDIAAESKRVKEMLIKNEKGNQQLTFELTKKISDAAIGLTERIIAENDLAFAYYNVREYDTAFALFNKVLRDAEMQLEKYGEPEQFLWVVGNIVSMKTMRRDFSGLSEFVAKAEPYFHLHLRAAANICWATARLKEECEGDYEGARKYYYQGLECWKKTNLPLTIARGQFTVGIFEYRQSNYNKAYELMKNAWQIFQTEKDVPFRISSSRDFAKLLIRMDNHSEAENVLSAVTNEIGTFHDFSDMEGELYLILAIATQNPVNAEKIIREQIGTVSIQKIAVTFLVHHYEKTGDLAEKTKYETIMKQMRGATIDLLLRETSGDPLHLLALHDFCHQQRWHLKS